MQRTETAWSILRTRLADHFREIAHVRLGDVTCCEGKTLNAAVDRRLVQLFPFKTREDLLQTKIRREGDKVKFREVESVSLETVPIVMRFVATDSLSIVSTI